MNRKFDFVIIGGGIVGLALADEISKKEPKSSILVLEQEEVIGLHASGNNSGVVHAGIYYKPGSLKAKLSVEGSELMRRFLSDNSVEHKVCGKVIVAKNATELGSLDELFKRGTQNGAELELIDKSRLSQINPLAITFDRAIWSPKTAVANPQEALEKLRQKVESSGVKLLTGNKVVDINGKKITTENEDVIEATSAVINVAGAGALKLAGLQGLGKNYRLTPFAGYYRYLDSRSASPTHIYPVPDLNLPFLGVHITTTTSGMLKVGPTALPRIRSYTSPARRSGPDQAVDSMLGFLGYGVRQPLTALKLLSRELNSARTSYLEEQISNIYSGPTALKQQTSKSFGIRSQLVNKKNGSLVDDFVLENSDGVFHVLNGVSPGWTTAFSVSKFIYEEISKQ